MVTFKQLNTAQARVTKTARKFGSLQTVYLQRKNSGKNLSRSLISRYRNAGGAYDDARRKYRALYRKYESEQKSKSKKYADMYYRMGQ